MNREIKFRVWDILDCRMITPDTGYQPHYILTLNGVFLNLQNGVGGNEVIVMQYTGLKDKNGVEIYEDDIVRVSSEQYINENYVGTIIFDEGSFLTKISDNDIRGVFSGEDQDIVVIGNIHTNPELLTQ